MDQRRPSNYDANPAPAVVDPTITQDELALYGHRPSRQFPKHARDANNFGSRRPSNSAQP